MMCSNFAIPDMQFFILKINGIDVCSLPPDEAVQMFLDANDPFLIEVCRRRSPNSCNKQNAASESAHHDPVTALPVIAEKNDNHPEQSKQSGSFDYGTTPINHRNRENATDSGFEGIASLSKKPHLTLYFPPSPSLLACDNLIHGCDYDHEHTPPVSKYRATIINAPESSYSEDNISQPPPGSNLLQGRNESDVTDKPQLISTAIQTDVSDFVSLFHVSNAATTNQMIEEEHNLFEACLAPEIDIEEITLRKSDSNEHLGLTVCYSMSSGNGNGSGTNHHVSGIVSCQEENESCTEVFISDIQPDSIAGRDGRLRQGDQILQVNGKDVTNKKETETLIAENNNAVTLLVSRYLYTDVDDFNETCVAGLDVEDDEDDDDEDEEFYNDNNLAYENCFISANECTSATGDQLNRAVLEASHQQTTTTLVSTPTPSTGTTATTTATTGNLVTVSVSPTTKYDDVHTKSGTAAQTATMSTSPTKTAPSTNSKTKSYCRGQLLLKYDPLNHQSIKAHLKQVNQELAILDCRMENLMIKPPGVVGSTALNQVDYDTEHIYETIPEDSETEPFYCSPYESSSFVGPSVAGNSQNPSIEPVSLQQQKQRVAAWLGMQTSQRTHHLMNTNGRGSAIVHYPHGIPIIETSTGGTTATLSMRSKSGTVRSAATNTTTGTTGTTGSSSSGGGLGHNDQENSSSAYNTGGSNNSGNALTLVLNASNTRTNNDSCDIEQQLAALRISKSQRLISPKNNLASPKHQSPVPLASPLIKIPVTRVGGIIHNDISGAVPSARPQQHQTQTTNTQHQQISTSTMYTNVANLQQTMLLQQQLFRQALTQQQQNNCINFQQQHQQEHKTRLTPPQSLHMHSCPQFTAPNLSQYHFVSSQEVSPEQMRAAAAAAVKASSTEEPMVWKVKRRQDGTRYIVRRPARTRMMRDRALRINAERENYDLTTTEDDTISEIKTGRYWTREERKKHIERARERRQQQQQQLATVTTMRIADKPTAALPLASSKSQGPKEKPSIATGQQNLSKLCRQASAKLQHHQLQFGSAATHTTDMQTTTSLDGCPKTAATLLSSGSIKALATPTNVVIESNSPDALSSLTTVNANSLTPTANASGVVGVSVQQYQQQQAVALTQATVGNNKIVGLLSVTTV